MVCSQSLRQIIYLELVKPIYFSINCAAGQRSVRAPAPVPQPIPSLIVVFKIHPHFSACQLWGDLPLPSPTLSSVCCLEQIEAEAGAHPEQRVA